MRSVFLAAGLLCLAISSAKADVPAFKSTCVKVSFGQTKEACVASNGKTLSSRFIWSGNPTTAVHTGCTSRGDSIRCSGGKWKNATGTGPHVPIVVRLSNGRPVSAAVTN